MKNLLNVLLLPSALFQAACGPSYDFSSAKALQASAAKQGIDEDIPAEDATLIISLYAIHIAKENKAPSKTFDSIESRERYELDLIKKDINGKTIKEMQEILEGLN